MEKRFFKHLLFWFTYLIFEVYTEFQWMSNIFKQFSSPAIFKMAFYPEIILLLLVKLPLVYISFYFLKVYNQNLKLVVLLTFNLVLWTFLGFLFYKYLFVSNFFHDLRMFKAGDLQGIINSFMDKIFILGTTIALKQSSISQKLKQREEILIKQKIEAELNFLKSQINPHFLFNTLNNIYSLARKKSDQTPEVVLKLSKLLRFVLYETQNNKIIIEKEIQFLNDYIELEKIRYDDKLNLKIKFQVDNFNQKIEPLLLIPILENAFKHGASEATNTTFIQLDFKLQKGKLEFCVENSFDKKAINSFVGIGLKNLKRQLEIIYPTYELVSQNENSVYKTVLKLDLN